MTVDPANSLQPDVVFFDPLGSDVSLADWRSLCEASLDPNPFFGPAFLRPFLDHMGPKSIRLLVLRSRDNGEWLMAAPIGRRRIGLAVSANTTWATDYSPLGMPLVHPGAEDDVIRLFFREGAGDRGLLAVPYLPLQSRTGQRLCAVLGAQSKILARAERASHEASDVGAQQLTAADGGKRRKERRRLLRRMADQGAVHFKSLYGTDVIQGFEAFLHLEAGGWKGRAGTALLSLPETAAFARLVVAETAAKDGIRIDQLWAGETLVAALVLFQERGRVFSWKIAFDEAFARFSPGAQIALHALKTNLASPGFVGADSLAIPGHSMIEPLWRGRLATGTLLYAEGAYCGLKQRLCALDVTLEQTARRAARTLKRRMSG